MIWTPKGRFASPHLYGPSDGSLKLHIDAMEYRGGKALDLSGNGNHGTITGAVIKPGPVGQNVFSFDGTDDNIALTLASAITSNVTLCVWAKWSAVQTSWAQILGAYPNSSYCDITFNSNNTSLRFVYNNIGSTKSIPSVNVFYFYCGVYDTTNVILYENAIASAPAANTVNVSHNKFYIGAETNNTAYYNGQANGIRIYNRALSASEISAIYDAERHLYGR